jgi:hypothetical protein
VIRKLIGNLEFWYGVSAVKFAHGKLSVMRRMGVGSGPAVTQWSGFGVASKE